MGPDGTPTSRPVKMYHSQTAKMPLAGFEMHIDNINSLSYLRTVANAINSIACYQGVPTAQVDPWLEKPLRGGGCRVGS